MCTNMAWNNIKQIVLLKDKILKRLIEFKTKNNNDDKNEFINENKTIVLNLINNHKYLIMMDDIYQIYLIL